MSLSADSFLPIRKELKSFNKHYYFDIGATPLSSKAASAMEPFIQNQFGNPSSFHQAGQIAQNALQQARNDLSQIINATSPTEIIFTSCATESDNLALKGVALAHYLKNNKNPKKNHLLISPIEHPGVTESIKSLKAFGYTYETLPINKYGLIDPAILAQKITPQTLLVSIMAANNQFGTIQDLTTLGKICRQKKVIFHTDAAVYFGLHQLDVQKMNLDLVTLSSPKIYGPKGIAALYKKSSVNLYPLLHGGDQEFSLRSGTHNLPAIIGFVAAAKEATKKSPALQKKYLSLSTYFKQELTQKLPQIIFNGHPSRRLANNIHLSILGVEGESLVLSLSQFGICTSSGSACSSHKLQADPALKALGLSPEAVHGSLRFFWHEWTTQKDLNYLIEKLILVTNRLRKISAYKAN